MNALGEMSGGIRLLGPLTGRGGGGDPFDDLIATLFSNGQNGFAFAPWKNDTLFQERTGASATTPAGVGDPVGTMKDVSGNGLYAVATADGKRGVLRQTGGGLYYIEFDGLDDGYRISGLTLGTEQYEWVGIEQVNGDPWFSEHSSNASANDGEFFYGSSGSSWLTHRDAGNHAAPGTSNWADGLHIIERNYVADDIGHYYLDGQEQSNGTVTGTAKGESSVTDTYNIGCRNQASLFFSDKLFGHILIDGATPSSGNITSMREILAEKAGVTL